MGSLASGNKNLLQVRKTIQIKLKKSAALKENNVLLNPFKLTHFCMGPKLAILLHLQGLTLNCRGLYMFFSWGKGGNYFIA